MGFSDEKLIIKALIKYQGNISFAAEFLLKENEKNNNNK